MANANTICPSCKSSEMISGGIHGMEHNVCTKCGTVLEIDQFTVDLFEGGSKVVTGNYDGRPYNYGFLLRNNSHSSRNHQDGLVTLKRLMDGLDLAGAVRDAAMDYFRYTKRLNKIASAGAVVYLAMKEFRMPVTIRCIANYLQVSHFTIGRVMRVLEKKLGHKINHSATFEVNELIPHLFSQAQFGVDEEKKRMLDLIIKKTDQLLCLLKECMVTTGYSPHLVALAAGFIVWKHLNVTKWSELNTEVDKLPTRPVKCLTVSLFLSEIGIFLHSQGHLTHKIALLQKVLCKLSKQIPWLSIRESCDVIIHLNDFLKYKSQIIDMTAKELAEKEMTGKDSKENIFMFKKEEEESIAEPGDPLQGSEISVRETFELPEVNSLAAFCCKSKQGHMCEEKKNPAEKDYKSSNTMFTRVIDLNIASQKPSEGRSKSPSNKRKAESEEMLGIESDGYSKLLLLSHPKIGKRKIKKPRINPLLLFP